MLGKGNRYLYQINKLCTNIVPIAVEVWSETEQQHEEIGDANTMKKTENAQGREHEEGTPGDKDVKSKRNTVLATIHRS